MSSTPTDSDAQPLVGDVPLEQATGGVPAQAPPDGWPWYYALFAPTFRPATAARKLAHLSLFQTFLIHLLTAVLFLMMLDLFAGLAEAAEDFGRQGWVDILSLRLGGMWSELWSEVVSDPEIAALMVIPLVGFEVQIALSALLIAPWGARDERVRASIRNAFRCVWLHSTHALVLLVLLGSILCVLTAMRAVWDARVEQLHPMPVYPADLPPGSTAQENEAHAEAVQKYQEDSDRHWEVRWQTRPWYVQFGTEGLIVWGFFPGLAWMLWALLRAVGAPRAVPALPRPPTCETCGYNLTGTPRDGRCSECGETVDSSLGEGVRPGVGWHRGGLLPLAWTRCAVRAAVDPAAIGRQIQVVARQTDHRLFLALSLIGAFLIGAGTFLLACYSDSPETFSRDRAEYLYFGAPAVGYLVAGLMLGLTLLVAWVVGLWYGRGAQRNLWPASIQMAVYVAPILLVWMFTSGVLIVLYCAGLFEKLRIVLRSQDWLRKVVPRLWFDPDVWFGIAMVLVAVLSLLLYLRLVARGVAAARYANR